MKLSKEQIDTLRITYAWIVLARFHPSIALRLFQKLVGSYSLYDIVKEDAAIFLKTYEEQISKLRIGESCSTGAFRVRRAKKGYVIYAEIVRARK